MKKLLFVLLALLLVPLAFAATTTSTANTIGTKITMMTAATGQMQTGQMITAPTTTGPSDTGPIMNPSALTTDTGTQAASKLTNCSFAGNTTQSINGATLSRHGMLHSYRQPTAKISSSTTG